MYHLTHGYVHSYYSLVTHITRYTFKQGYQFYLTLLEFNITRLYLVKFGFLLLGLLMLNIKAQSMVRQSCREGRTLQKLDRSQGHLANDIKDIGVVDII